MSEAPDCTRCGGTLEQPQKGAQYECSDCGAVVAPDMVQQQGSGGWEDV
jgi:predicted RNA-binding Zn-ribbon protein involved in translation (DUF1610 family)